MLILDFKNFTETFKSYFLNWCCYSTVVQVFSPNTQEEEAGKSEFKQTVSEKRKEKGRKEKREGKKEREKEERKTKKIRLFELWRLQLKE